MRHKQSMIPSQSRRSSTKSAPPVFVKPGPLSTRGLKADACRRVFWRKSVSFRSVGSRRRKGTQGERHGPRIAFVRTGKRESLRVARGRAATQKGRGVREKNGAGAREGGELRNFALMATGGGLLSSYRIRRGGKQVLEHEICYRSNNALELGATPRSNAGTARGFRLKLKFPFFAGSCFRPSARYLGLCPEDCACPRGLV